MPSASAPVRFVAAATTAVALLAANMLLPAAAIAIEPPMIDPAALPPDGVPGPDQEMKQDNTCAAPLTVAVPDVVQPAPGNVMLAVPQAWKFSTGAGVKVGLIDTGVTPNPRLPALSAGGDYVMGDANGGLSDCDSHGTVVASIIAAQPSDPRPGLLRCLPVYRRRRRLRRLRLRRSPRLRHRHRLSRRR